MDDWAWKKGQTFGTILVDLERGVVVDLLAERSAASTAAWLAGHPGVEFVSRDRHGLYADGARRGAPQALQIADRFPSFLISEKLRSTNWPVNAPSCRYRDRQQLSLLPQKTLQVASLLEPSPTGHTS